MTAQIIPVDPDNARTLARHIYWAAKPLPFEAIAGERSIRLGLDCEASVDNRSLSDARTDE
jgi:hypothetical protein